MHLRIQAERYPDKPALIMGATGRTVTYKELNDRSLQVVQLLAAHGLGFGDHIALMMENCAEYLEVCWAAFRSGLYVTPINHHLTQNEVAHVVKDCGASALFMSPKTVSFGLVDLLSGQIKNLLLVTTGDAVGKCLAYEKSIKDYTPEQALEELEGAYMFYSSGTTGRPKGILRPLKRQVPGEEPDVLAQLLSGLYHFDKDTVYLSPGPLYHAAPTGWTMATHRLGGTVVIMEHFAAQTMLELVERYQVTHTQVVPTMFVRMLKLPDEQRNSIDLSSLKTVVHAAAPCPVKVKQQMLDWLGPIIYEYFAASEGFGFVAVSPEDWLAHPGTVGRMAQPGIKLHILDDEGNELPAGEVGIVYFEGFERFEYHGDSDKTSEVYNDKGFATSGDMGYLDEDGYLYLVDRVSNMIIAGGVNIYPQESEEILIMHPKVADVAVIGVPHPEYGEEIKAVVQLANKTDAGPVLEAELLAFVQEQLAKYKCPRSVDFVDKLPRLASGKLLKRRLKDQYWGDTNYRHI